ncbi:Hypothetical predicted protein [Cloeon dipterum]|uniref:G-protein coupled receptors family 1 profile domain-containing protein n=1 Tax=Cloeon dipterum TaxID=197152 RepID=A0A8S1DVL9_9INSE|nr:Hypothetical predicted protein [Cloeon dipterum]
MLPSVFSGHKRTECRGKRVAAIQSQSSSSCCTVLALSAVRTRCRSSPTDQQQLSRRSSPNLSAAMGAEYDNLTYDDNSTANCTNDYCIPDDDYLALMESYIFPTPAEWCLIAFHGLVFIAGLIGNALVCAAVIRNPGMRTVTNYFIVNLAVADFMVLVFCLPPTVLWDVTETWFLGDTLCKGVLYTQTEHRWTCLNLL